MKKLLIILSLVFLVGCVPQVVDEDTATACPFNCAGGSSGLNTVIQFPSEGGNIFTSDRFAPLLKIENRGEANAEGVLLLTGLTSDVFGGYTGCYPIDLNEIVVDDPDAQYFKERSITNLQGVSVNEEASGEQTLTTITRYTYKTYGIFDAFVTGNPIEESRQIQGNKLRVSSSGPVNIDSITEEITPVGPGLVTLRLNVDASVSARGNERLIETRDTTNTECVLPKEEGIVFTDVEVDVVFLGERHDCGIMRFEKGEGDASVTCRVDNLDTQLFIGGQQEKEGYVELTYGFQNIQSTNFNVLKG